MVSCRACPRITSPAPLAFAPLAGAGVLSCASEPSPGDNAVLAGGVGQAGAISKPPGAAFRASARRAVMLGPVP
jgi:hypothetical protein